MPKAVTKITIQGAKTIRAGKRIRLSCTVAPSNKVYKGVTWEVNTSEYATITSKGVLVAKEDGKGRTIKVTARALDGSNKKGTIQIRIK